MINIKIFIPKELPVDFYSNFIKSIYVCVFQKKKYYCNIGLLVGVRIVVDIVIVLECSSVGM